MEVPKHDRTDRLIIARVAGTTRRHSCANPVDVAAAVADLHTITTDAHLLAHGLPGPGDWTHETAMRILLAAGAGQSDLDEVTAWSSQAGHGLGAFADRLRGHGKQAR